MRAPVSFSPKITSLSNFHFSSLFAFCYVISIGGEHVANMARIVSVQAQRTCSEYMRRMLSEYVSIQAYMERSSLLAPYSLHVRIPCTHTVHHVRLYTEHVR